MTLTPSSHVVRTARAMTERFSTSYALAARLFPAHLRAPTYVLYAFFRTSDEIVDSQAANARERLDEWCALWDRAYISGESSDELVGAAAAIFREHAIPREVADSFFDAMRADAEKKSYRTRAELYDYAVHAAGTVGVAMAHLMGRHEVEVTAYAERLGAAIQITNILRDIREDYDDLGRIYLPQEDLERFGVSEDDIRGHRLSAAFKYLMHEYVEYNRELYRDALPGIELLPAEGRLPVRLASRISLGILDAIDKNEYDIFEKRVRVPSWKKATLLLSAGASEALARLRF